ncbi:MAG: ferric reductase-like transmembrane domain-containing protein [Actinomycetota bacterium]
MTLWYATRGTGIVSLVLLTAIVVLGIAGSQRLRSDRWPRFLVVGLHRNLTLLALVFLAVHIGTSVLDSYAPIRLVDAVVPFVSAYRPVWLGLGAVAFDLLLALTVTSLLRARIGYRSWRVLHWLAYVSWPVALVHALGTGSDARVSWLQGLAIVATLGVAAAVLVRLRTAASASTPRLAAAALVLIVPLGILVWYRTGPGGNGWAARAGTPTSLLAPKRVVAKARTTPVAATLPSPPFTAQLSGSLSQASQTDGQLVLVNIRGHTTGGARGVLWVRLQGAPTGDGGVQMTASGASYGPQSSPNAYVGKIVQLNGTQMVLELSNSAGTTLDLTVDLRIDSATRHISGTVSASGVSQ